MADETFEAMVRLLADNKAFVKAFKESSDSAKATGEDVQKSSDEASLSMDRLTEHAHMLRDAMTSLVGVVGIGGLAFGLKDLVEGGETLQLSQSRLQAALHDTGQDAAGTADELNKLAASMSIKGGFSTTENLNALTQFVRETHSATEAQNLLNLSTNIARGTGQSLSDTTTVVAKAYDGQARGLQALLGPMVAATNAQVGLTVAHQNEIAKIQEQAAFLSGPAKTAYVQQAELADHITAAQQEQAQLTDKQITAQQLLTDAQARFADATDKYSNTVEGRQAALSHSVQNLTESIGMDLLPAMRVLVGLGVDVADVLEHERGVVEVLAVGVGVLAAAWGGMKILGGIKTMVLDLGKAFGVAGVEGEEGGLMAALGADEAATAWRAFMTTTIFGLVIIGLVELIEHWDAVRDAAVHAWHDIEHDATVLWHAIVDGAKWAFSEIKTGLNDLGFTGNGIMSYLNPFGAERHLISGIGSLLNQGGVVQYRADGGPMMPSGTDTVPTMLSPGEGVLSVQGMETLDRINSGQLNGFGGGNLQINAAGQIVLRTTDRDIGQAALRWFIDQGARGPSTNIGGSLAISGVGTAGY